MFRGSLPQQAQAIVSEIVEQWDCQSIYVGCSGNFTIERCLISQPKQLHSNDVTMYSCTLGRYFARQDLRVEFNEEYEEVYGWLKDYLETPEDRTATVMLCTKLFDGFGKNNPFYNRLREAFRAQWPELHAKTVKKLVESNMQVASFHAGDVVDWAAETPRDQGFVCFPPFFGGDYEKMNASLDAVFDWDKPTYPIMDDDRKDMLFERIRSKDFWLIGLHHKQEHMQEYLHGICQTTNRGVPIYLYTNAGPRRRVGPAQKVEPVTIPRLSRGQEIGSQLGLVKLTGGQFQALRSQYMNVGIKPGQPTVAIGVTVDGVLVGCYALALPNSVAHSPPKYSPLVYLLSDFPVAPSDYPRLSKLVLMAALSKEGKLLAERMIRRRVRGILTTAFTNNPVSMKYRGLFDLVSRKENEAPKEGASISDTYYAQRYQLNYATHMGKWTLEEALATWKKKHGARNVSGV